jgi:biopolymer transport protein ExbB
MSEVFQEAFGIWRSGGWAMIALALNALILFALGINLWLNLKTHSTRKVPEETWKRWISRKSERRGHIGELLDFVTGARDLDELGIRFNELYASEIAPFTRDLKFMKRCVSTAPLLGLLGTVTGMLATFAALATGSGGEKTMDMVAGGISEALITTETGLLIALPGLFFQFHLTRERERYEAFLAHLETACTQHICSRDQLTEATA